MADTLQAHRREEQEVAQGVKEKIAVRGCGGRAAAVVAAAAGPGQHGGGVLQYTVGGGLTTLGRPSKRAAPPCSLAAAPSDPPRPPCGASVSPLPSELICLQEAVQTEQNYKQVLTFAFFVVAYMLALYVQASTRSAGCARQHGDQHA